MATYAKYGNLGSTSIEKSQQQNDRNDRNDPNDNQPKLHSIVSEKDRENIIRSNKIVVVDNYASWCTPCKSVDPKYTKLGMKYNKDGICMLVKEDVDMHLDNRRVKDPISSVPCFHFYREGIHMKTIMGADINDIESTINTLLSL
jgi:thioredoxin 1